MQKNTKIIGSLLFILLVCGGLLGYYLYPLTADSVLNHPGNIQNVNIGYYLNNGKISTFSIDVKDPAEINEFVNILKSSTYTRSLGTKNIKNNARAILLIIFYTDDNRNLNNYSFDINDHGYLVIENKKYRIEHKQDIIFNRIYDWLLKNTGTN